MPKKYRQPENRLWVEPAPPEPAEWKPAIRIEDVNGTPVEVRIYPDGSELVRPPSITMTDADGKEYQVRLVASAWYGHIYAPWLRKQRGIAELAERLPDQDLIHDGLLTNDEDDHEFLSDTA